MSANTTVQSHTSPVFLTFLFADSFLGQNRTPIHFAAYQGQLHALYGLIKLGKNVNSRTVDGVTPLHEACSRGNFYCAKMLIQAGAEVIVNYSSSFKEVVLVKPQNHELTLQCWSFMCSSIQSHSVQNAISGSCRILKPSQC